MKFKNNNHPALFNNEAKRMNRHHNVKMAVLYLLTADFKLWNEAKRHIKRGNIDLDIPHRSFHSLRHTFATSALECGMDVKTLSEILGHKNPTVTLNRYVRSLMEHKKEMMNKLGKLL